MNIEIEISGKIVVWYTIAYLKAAGVDTVRMLTDSKYLDRLTDSVLAFAEERLGYKLCMIEDSRYVFIEGKFKMFCQSAQSISG